MGEIVASEVYVRWRCTSLSGPRPTYDVVRITRTAERLAGPFKTVRAAQKWIESGQLTLGGDACAD